MEITHDISREELDDFVKHNEHGHLLQSYAWGEFQCDFGERVYRVAVKKDGKLVAALTLIGKEFGVAGKFYLYGARGPVLADPEDQETIETLMNGAHDLAKKEGAMFVRIAPEWQDTPKWMTGWKKAPQELDPKETRMLKLERTEDELLAQMKSKTRYNIRLSAKKGVEVTEGQDDESLQAFLQLNKETSARDGFTPHKDEYYEKQIKNLGSNVHIYVAWANLDGERKPIAANIVTHFARRATYVHGTSSNEGRNLMPTFALQWKAIQDANHFGLTEYDFWGITTSDDENHPWTGITRFKNGFGGDVVQYIGAYDLVMQPLWYAFYKIYKRFK